MSLKICESCCKHIKNDDIVKKHYHGKDVYYHTSCWNRVK